MSQQNVCIDDFVAPVARKPRPSAFGFGKILAAFQEWRERQANLRQFQRLNDQQLRDVGINRHDLPPALQDQLATSHGPHGLLNLFPHSVIAGLDRNRRSIRD